MILRNFAIELLFIKAKKIYDGEIKGVKEEYGYLATVEVQVKEEISLESLNIFDDIYKDKDFKIDFKENKLFITFNINKISSSEIISRVMKKITVVDFAVKRNKYRGYCKEDV